MPYIKPEDRKQYDVLVDEILEVIMANAGDGDFAPFNPSITKGHHNYVMFTLALKLAKRLGNRYYVLQDIVGTFECCKAEFLRRVVDPYEDKAIAKNGDIDDLKQD